MARNRFFQKYCLIFCITVFTFTVLAVLKSVSQDKSSYPINQRQMTYHPGSQTNDQINDQTNNRLASQSSSNQHPFVHLEAKEFYFETHVDFPSPVLKNPDQYTESITHDSDGVLDLTLIKQENSTKYLLQVSERSKQQCQSEMSLRCEREAVPARGNVAEIQIVLSGNRLTPGTYTFGEDGAIPGEDVIVYSRQLYSDPSHGKLGCRVWGMGGLNITKAVYTVDGQLEYFDANLFRMCNQTAPFPTTLPEDNLPQVQGEGIEKYTFHTSWRSHLKVTEEQLK